MRAGRVSWPDDGVQSTLFTVTRARLPLPGQWSAQSGDDRLHPGDQPHGRPEPGVGSGPRPRCPLPPARWLRGCRVSARGRGQANAARPSDVRLTVTQCKLKHFFKYSNFNILSYVTRRDIEAAWVSGRPKNYFCFLIFRHSVTVSQLSYTPLSTFLCSSFNLHSESDSRSPKYFVLLICFLVKSSWCSYYKVLYLKVKLTQAASSLNISLLSCWEGEVSACRM